MRLKQLHIENFRALETMDIEFHPMTVIVGENDVGKTSSMLAIQTLFEQKKLEDKSDYFKARTQNPVTIDACFACPAPNDTQVAYIADGSIRLKCTYPFNESRKAEVLKRIPVDEAFQDIGQQSVGDLRSTLVQVGLIEEGANTPKPEAQKLLADYVLTLPDDQFSKGWSDISEADLGKLLPDFVLVSVGRSLDDALRMTDTSLFGKLFRPLLKDAMKQIVEEDALADVRTTLKDSVKQQVEDLQTLMQEQLNNDTVHLTHEVDIEPLKGLLFDFGLDDERASGIPIGNRGAGIHNNLTLAMFRLLAQYKAENFILAIEEPENSLHPRGQREMLWALQGLAKTAQVICTTHSTVFLDLGQLEDNIVLTRTAQGNTIARSFQAAEPKDVLALRDVLGIRISDALLSGGGNCALIVEGATELHAYPHFFSLCGYNARALGVSIITVGGSDTQSIKHILRVLNVYGIPAVVVLDGDAKKSYDDFSGYGPGGELPNLRKVHLLADGTFETYIPIQIAVDIMNERFDGEQIKVGDIDRNKDRLDEFEKALYLRKNMTARFEFFKVQFGQLVGARMVKDGCQLHPHIAAAIEDVKAIAEEIYYSGH